MNSVPAAERAHGPQANKASRAKLLRAERSRLAMLLRRRGAEYRAIAETLRGQVIEADGSIRPPVKNEDLSACLVISPRYSEGAAYADVMAELARLREKTAEDAEAVRKIELDRLDVMLAAVWDRAEAGQTDAIHTVLTIQARRTRYIGGLEVPTRQEVTGADGGPIDVRTLSDDQLRAIASGGTGGAGASGEGA